MSEHGQPKTVEEFQEMTVEEQRTYLAHPVWPMRCQCKRYGLPWPTQYTILDNDGWVHREDVCAPSAEFP